jgi:hypothetical protein
MKNALRECVNARRRVAAYFSDGRARMRGALAHGRTVTGDWANQPPQSHSGTSPPWPGATLLSAFSPCGPSASRLVHESRAHALLPARALAAHSRGLADWPVFATCQHRRRPSVCTAADMIHNTIVACSKKVLSTQFLGPFSGPNSGPISGTDRPFSLPLKETGQEFPPIFTSTIGRCFYEAIPLARHWDSNGGPSTPERKH